MVQKSPTFCFKAYYSNLYIDADSMARICCKQSRKYRFDLSDKKNYKKYVNELRRYMEKGEWHPSCKQCKDLEDNGNISVRQFFNQGFKNSYSYLKGKHEYKIRYLEINFSNVCNLACKMCVSPISSGRKGIDKHLGLYESDIFKLNPSVLGFLYQKENILSLEHLAVFGGEPFLEDLHFDFLLHLIEIGISSNITLSYNSNLTVIPSFQGKEKYVQKGICDIFDLWEYFKKVDLRVSLDGYGETDEYIRMNSKWESVIKNLNFIKSREISNLDLMVSSTVQIDNILDLTKLFLFLDQIDVRIAFSANNYVVIPKYLNIQIMPSGIKEYIKIYYKKFFLKYPNMAKKHKKDIDEIFDFMDGVSSNSGLFNEYIRYTNQYNEYFNLEYQNKILDVYAKFYKNLVF